MSFDVPMATDHLFREIGLKFVEGSTVQQTREHITHLIRHSVVVGENVVEILWRPGRVDG
jgi:hypothetical protein